jgi:hypothetical protein
MFGQGSPYFQRDHHTSARRNQLRVFGYRFALIFTLLLLTCSNVVTICAQESRHFSSSSEKIGGNLKLRFAWGGGVPQKWNGKLTIDNGEIDVNRILAITSDAPSTVISRGGELIIDHRIATSYGGIDAAITFDGDPSVSIQLTSESGQTFEQQWTLSQLESGINEPLDQQQNRISISRTPGDQVRVGFDRPHLVFSPGETWLFDVQLQRCRLRNQKLNVQFFWKGTEDQKIPIFNEGTEYTTDANGTSAAQNMSVMLPDQEGVHDLWIEVTPLTQTTFGQFRRSKKLTRRVQVVVVSPDSPINNNAMTWETEQTFTPQQLKGNFRPPWPLPRLPNSKEPIRSGDLSVISVGESESALEFAPGSSLAIPIYRPDNVLKNQPIKISFRYRPVAGTKLGVHYLSSTQQVLNGMDSGISVPGSILEFDSSEKWLTHEFFLWPEDEAGHLYIANIDSQTRAQIGDLKIEVGPKRLSSQIDSLGYESDSNFETRQRMAMLESPDFSGLFQAARIVDPLTGQALDDWQTFYDSTDRLTQHLKANFYDGAFVTVASDGSAIFPSGGLAPGPRFDAGVFCSDGCDPVQKDILELMLRMFEREGLKLVPVLTLNSTLPQLERIRETRQMSFDLVDFEGQLTEFNRRSLPIYNPLDRNLQGVCLDGVGKIATRYQQHASFGGIALTCRPDCCTLLPGTQHGFDDITVQRFLQSQNIDPSTFQLETLLPSDVENPIYEAWLAWRSAQMQAWYRDIAKVARGNSRRSLYLLPIDLYQKSNVVSAMSPSLHRSGDFAKVMQELGLCLDSLTKEDSVVLLAPKQIAFGSSLAKRRIDLNIEQSRIAEQFFADKSGGSLFAHRGKWEQLDAKQSNQDSKTVTRNNLLVVGGDSNRRRYIEAIRKYDCRLFVDGGETLPRGERESLSSISRTLRQLPAERFEEVGEPNSGPVCVRQFSKDGQHWFYAVNDSPWPVEVTALLGDPNRSPQVLQAASRGRAKAPLTTLDGDKITLEQLQGRSQLRIFLEPWSMYAGTSRTNSDFNPFAISSFSTLLPEEVDSQLRKRLYQLKNKFAKAKVAKPLVEFQNGGFESFVDPDKSGWEFGNHDEANFELDSTAFHEGKTSLSMQTDGKPVWIRSNTLTLPQTGRLSISVWLRTIDPANQPSLRISLDGVSDGANLYRFGAIGSSSATPDVNPIDSQWRRYAVHFDDLPDDLTEIRIGFDLMEPGQVSIDQVEVLDRWFDENDSVAITQLLASAGSQLQNPDSVDGARRILENYWVRFLDQYIGNESKVASKEVEKSKPFQIPLPSFDMPSFELPASNPKKTKRNSLFQRLQRRE